jgi:acetyl esterase/lipase
MSHEQVRPALLWIHGGALIGGHRGNIRGEQLERYLDAGFTVVSIDYRLAPETKLPAIIEDLRDAYGWLRSEGPRLFKIDPDRVAVVGHSAGGYLTLMAGVCVKPRPKALVAFYGYGDIAGEWYSRPDPFYCRQPIVPEGEAYRVVGGPALSESDSNDRFRFYLYCRQQGLWPREVAGYDPDTEPRAFDAFCPLRNVTQDYPSTMLLHGDQDTDVPYQQSVLMAQALERSHVEYQLITVIGGGHGFDGADGGLKYPANAKRFETVLDFLKGHTQ